MSSHVLTPEQEATAHKLDTAGLALIGAGVAGEVMHRHGAPGGALSRFGAATHHLGPYLDLAGLALIAPPVMNRVAQKLTPDKPKDMEPGPDTGPVQMQSGPDAVERSVADTHDTKPPFTPDTTHLLQPSIKTAAYELGARAAIGRYGGLRP